MATISYLLLGTKPVKKIYCRLSVKRGEVYQCPTKYTIHKDDWSKTKKQPILRDEDLKKKRSDLDDLGKKILLRLDEAVSEGVILTNDWLREQVSNNGEKPKIESKKEYLDEAFENYITTPPIKNIKSKPRSSATITKYRTLKNKIKSFQKFKKRRFLVKDVGIEFRDEFYKYLITHPSQNLSNNTAGRYLSFVKTVCLDAKMRGAEVHHQLSAVTGSSEPAHKVFLSFNEIDKIKNTTLKRDALDNARDWLVIGCYIGQRVSDLLTLTTENIIYKNGLYLIEVTQKKTGKTVYIPITEPVQEILDKRDGDLPRPISSAKFNLHIKEVAKISGLTEMIKGAKINKETNRKEEGVFPKHELITSHVCRRSFATNYYGEMITSLIIQITGHSTEKQFLEYVGKPQIDNAQQIAEYFSEIYHKEIQKRSEVGLLQLRKA